MPEIQTVTFNYTGAVQIWTVPRGVRQITIDCYGASGGNGHSGSGGKGGRAKATFNVSEGEILYIYVGGAGKSAATSGNKPTGGWNGGGESNCTEPYWGDPDGEIYAGGGGGASDVRRGGQTLNHRIIVAGGGGGGGRLSNGGNGGGLTGTDGNSPVGSSFCGKGGTQTAGGAGGIGEDSQRGVAGTFGYGGNATEITSSYRTYAGAGGGGWYGGGTGCAIDADEPDYYGGGGGGSGYIHPNATNQLFETGVRSGNGLVIITYEVITPLYVRINGQARESESIHVKVNGQLRAVEKIWAKVNGQLREV